MNSRHVQPYLSSSLAIRQEIQRFESVHPSIYAIYDIIELIPDPVIAQQIREHVVCIEDSFVNSQEWTLSRGVPDLRLGIVGSLSSGKSALVHRYLTGSYMQEESPEGGRFKKEIVVDSQSFLLLIRDEGGPPELQFTSWVDAVVFVFSLENESSFNAIYNYYAKMAHFRNTSDVPLVLVGTQDAISENNPRVIDDIRARKLAADLKCCSYYETCATYGLNVERVFQDACSKIVAQRLLLQQGITPSNSRPSTPTHLLRFPTNPAPASNGFVQPLILPKNSSPSHAFSSNTLSKDARANNALLELSRSDSVRVSGFMPPPSLEGLSTPREGLPTPTSTPTTSRKSRRKSNLFTPSRKTDSKNGEVGSGRAIPLKQGYLYKKSNKALNKDWKKKYVTLCDDGKLTYHPSLHDYMEDIHGKEISLQYTTVKVPGMKPRGSKVVGAEPLASDLNSLNLVSANSSSTSSSLASRPSLGGVSNTKEKASVTLTSYEALRESSGINGIDTPSALSKMETPSVKKRHRRMKSSGNKNADCEDQDGYEFSVVSLDNKQWHFEAASQEERDEWMAAIEQQILTSLQGNETNKARTIDPQAISSIKTQVPGNAVCADCDAPNPEWASINLGILVCIECSGIHRNLGSHVSKVRSLDLDELPPGPLSVMRTLGNEVGNSVWEARIRVHIKPGPKTSREEKEKWIKAKYEKREFLLPLPHSLHILEQLVECVCRGDARALSAVLPYASVDSVNLPINPPRDLRTPLHLAAAYPSLPCVQLLLWANANPKSCDLEGRTPVYYARTSGDKDVADLLMQNGCPEAPATLPRPKGTFSRKPEVLDKLQASVI